MNVSTSGLGSSATYRAERRDWRGLIFRIVGGLTALLVLGAFGGLPAALTPWLPAGEPTPGYTPEMHQWHDSQWGAHAVFLWGLTLASLVWRPRTQPLLAQYLAATILVYVVMTVPLNPENALVLPILGPAVLTYPRLRSLFAFQIERPISKLLAVLALVAAIALFPDVWTNFGRQLIDQSEHAQVHHWIGAAALSVILAVAGLLTATRQAGWRAMGLITGLTYAYLGLAALWLPRHDGSWGVAGGVAALAFGVAFIATVVAESRRADARST